MAKRGAHAPLLIDSAPDGFDSFESTHGWESLVGTEDWFMAGVIDHCGSQARNGERSQLRGVVWNGWK
jgi:hypothetical protein